MELRNFKTEVQVILTISWPMTLVFLLHMLTLPISIVFCGHLGTVIMDAVSMASTFLNMFGIYSIMGMTTACYTVFSQVYGSSNKENMGLVLQRGLVVLVLACVPMVAVLINIEFIMMLAGQSVQVSRETGQFLNIAVIGLPGMAIWSVLRSYTYTQGIIHAQYFIIFASDLVNVGFHFIFVTFLGMGSQGAALSYCLTNWVTVGLYMTYIFLMKAYDGLWTGWTLECFDNLGELLTIGVSGMMMQIVEWSAYDVIALTVAKFWIVEQDAFCIAYTLDTILTALPQGLVYGGSVRVGNHLGANKPELAKCAYWTTVILAIPFGITLPILLVFLRHEIPYAFTSNRDVADISSIYLLWVALIVVLDGFQMSLKGLLGSIGRQSYAALVNVFAYILLALPLAFPLMLKTSLGVEGGFVGLVVAAVTQVCMFGCRLMVVDWEKEALIAQERVADVKKHKPSCEITIKRDVNILKSRDGSNSSSESTDTEDAHSGKTLHLSKSSGYGATMSTLTDKKTSSSTSQTDEIAHDKSESKEDDGDDRRRQRKKVLLYKAVMIISVFVAILAASIVLNRFLTKLFAL